MSSAQETETGAAAAAGSTASPGAQLEAARKERGLDVYRVARELNLDPAIIEALEQDNRDALPAPIFVKGYMRSYARLVGLPEAELVRAYAQQADDLPPLTVSRIRQSRPLLGLPSARLLRNIALLLLLLIMLWLAWPFVDRLLDSREGEQEQEVPGHIELPPARQ